MAIRGITTSDPYLVIDFKGSGLRCGQICGHNEFVRRAEVTQIVPLVFGLIFCVPHISGPYISTRQLSVNTVLKRSIPSQVNKNRRPQAIRQMCFVSIGLRPRLHRRLEHVLEVKHTAKGQATEDLQGIKC